MPPRKKFDKLGTNPRFADDSNKKFVSSYHETDKETGGTYSMRPSKAKKPVSAKVYEVGSVEVYAVFLVSFILMIINTVLTKEGAYTGLDTNLVYTIKCVLYAVIFLVPGAVYCKLRKKSVVDTFSAYKFSPSYIPFIVLSFLLLTFVIAAERFAVDAFFPVVHSKQDISLSDADNKLGMILAYAVFPAIFEEMLFRGILQKEISEKAGGITGIAVSAFTFALIHFDGRYFVVYLCSGLILAVCAHVTNSVFPGMVVHALNNLVSLLFSSRLAFVASENSGNMLVLVVLILIAFLVLLFYLRSLESLCTKKAVFEDIVKDIKHKRKDTGIPDTETDSDKEATAKESDDSSYEEVSKMYYRKPYRLCSSSGYSFHKFLRVMFSPAIIVAVVLFFFVITR